jgi:ATP-dependent 26S proteasome regulatory subunit
MLNKIFIDSPDTLDPALLRPGRLDRKVEFSLPDLEVYRNLLYPEEVIDKEI